MPQTFPHVKPGERVSRSAALENAIRDVVNRMGATGGGVVKGSKATTQWQPCYNSGSVAIPKGYAVIINKSATGSAVETAIANNVVPVKLYDEDDWLIGVAKDVIPVGEIGSVAFHGIVEVEIDPYAANVTSFDYRVWPKCPSSAVFAGVGINGYPKGQSIKGFRPVTLSQWSSTGSRKILIDLDTADLSNCIMCYNAGDDIEYGSSVTVNTLNASLGLDSSGAYPISGTDTSTAPLDLRNALVIRYGLPAGKHILFPLPCPFVETRSEDTADGTFRGVISHAVSDVKGSVFEFDSCGGYEAAYMTSGAAGVAQRTLALLSETETSTGVLYTSGDTACANIKAIFRRYATSAGGSEVYLVSPSPSGIDLSSMSAGDSLAIRMTYSWPADSPPSNFALTTSGSSGILLGSIRKESRGSMYAYFVTQSATNPLLIT